MSISEQNKAQIERLKNAIEDAYSECNAKGATMPSTQNAANLADCIESIEKGITPAGTREITTNGTHDVTQYATVEVNVSAPSNVVSFQKGVGEEIWYFPLATMVKDDSGNYGDLTFNGRLGGWTNANTAVYSIMLMNRGDYTGNIITATVAASGQYDAAIGLTDIVVAKNDDLSHTVYLKCTGYFCYNFTWTAYQHSIIYDGSHTTAEPNNIIWRLSTAPKTILGSDGSFIASGGIIANNSDKVDGLHFVVSDTVPTVDDKNVITFVVEK